MPQFDPNRPDFSPYGFTCVRWTPSQMRRPDHHNEIEINFLTSGSVTYLLGGQKVVFSEGFLGAFWAAIPHQILDFEPGSAYFVLTIPLAWFLQCKLPERFTQYLMQGGVVSEKNPERRQIDSELFAQWQLDLENGKQQVEDVVMLEVEARLRRLAFSAKQAMATKPRAGRLVARTAGLTKVEEMACLVARRYTEPLSIQEISGAVSLHPNYAMNLFKKTFGTTLVDYLTHHRISHAQRLLATSDEKILNIALSSGFNSLSRFNEAFRRACGCSPRHFREGHRQEDHDNGNVKRNA